MPPTHLASDAPQLTARFLSFCEREEIAILLAQGATLREIARKLERSPSTISREVRRNAATRGGALDYRASAAQWRAERSAGDRVPANSPYILLRASMSRRGNTRRLCKTTVAQEI